MMSDAVIANVEIYRRPGEFAAWPANYGLWAWGEEVVAVFAQGFLGADEGLHARDKSRPFMPRQARSRDGGLSWIDEPFNGVTPGGPVLSGDEHVEPVLRSGPRIDAARDLQPLAAPIDFLDPETIVMCARTDLGAGSLSWFYVSRDRARSWQGPFRLGDFGQPGIAARTDIVALGHDDALFMLTAAKTDGDEGRVFCARTRDGGRSFRLEGFVGGEPEGFAIMPASVRLSDGAVLTAMRCASGGPWVSRTAWIELYRSDDLGATWRLVGRPVENTGRGGNPPTLTLLPDGRLVLVYGYRDAPFGIRARVSADNGASWSADIILRDDGGMSDLGYPRTVLLPGGRLLSVYYLNAGATSERWIAGSLFQV